MPPNDSANSNVPPAIASKPLPPPLALPSPARAVRFLTLYECLERRPCCGLWGPLTVLAGPPCPLASRSPSCAARSDKPPARRAVLGADRAGVAPRCVRSLPFPAALPLPAPRPVRVPESKSTATAREVLGRCTSQVISTTPCNTQVRGVGWGGRGWQ